jgi:hypothetical protein
VNWVELAYRGGNGNRKCEPVTLLSMNVPPNPPVNADARASSALRGGSAARAGYWERYTRES